VRIYKAAKHQTNSTNVQLCMLQHNLEGKGIEESK